MRLHLVTKSRQLPNLCQEVLGDILGRGWTLHVASGTGAECAADLYVWDLDPEDALPAVDYGQGWRHFFVMDRLQIPSFQESMGGAKANILVNPVSRATLLAFLTDACDRALKEGPYLERSAVALRAERDNILQGLLHANLRLQEYDQDRTNFLARAIHDFRAPLTALSGYCGILVNEDAGSITEQQRELLMRMQHSAKKLSRMASGMFQLGIALRTEPTPNLQPGEIRTCVEQALHEILPAAEEKRLNVSVDLAASQKPVHFEQMRLEQVLLNLLENACRFTPRLGSIEIRGYPWFWERRQAEVTGIAPLVDRRRGERQAPNCYRVDISDTGPGIPAAHMSKIFEEYTSYGGGSDRSGGGLGLAICRMIITQHKGRIWAENRTDGARFSFVLPFQGETCTETARAAQASGF